MSRFFLVAITTLGFGLISVQGRSADLLPDQNRTSDAANKAPTAVAPASNSTFSEDPFGYLISPFRLADRPILKQSVSIFGGRTASTNLNNSILWNVNAPQKMTWDNTIVGGSYQRDFIHLNGGFFIGGEIGLADRFGHHKICCDTIVYSNSLLQSAELWAGIAFRHQGVALFDTVRISPTFVFGLSAISSPIGQEGLNQIAHKGSAKLLFYSGFEGAFSLLSRPDTELYVRVHHRSGAYGTLGGMKEGNNANIFGIRQRF